MALPGNLSVWLTPVWLLSLGVTGGLLVLLAIWGLLWLVSRRANDMVLPTLSEGVLKPISYLVLFLALFTVVVTLSMPYDSVLPSLGRMFSVGTIQQQVTIPANTIDHPLSIEYRGEELRWYQFYSDQDLYVSADLKAMDKVRAIRVEGGEQTEWFLRSLRSSPIAESVSTLYVTNESDSPASFTAKFITEVEYPQVYIVPYAAMTVIVLYLIYFLFRFGLPKISAVAVTTAKEACTQPLYFVTMALGACALVLFVYIPYNTFGEDVKMLKDSSLTLIMVLSIVVALWTSSVSVADEIEGRTALTLLSKPISRRQFILGKYLGIIWPVVLMFVLLGVLFLVTVSYKVVYDARETSQATPGWQLCYFEMVRIVPGLILAFLETAMLASISVAISTRLSMLPNLIICASVYVLGHLGPLIVNSSAGKFEIVSFVGKLIAVVLPVLDHLNIQPAIAAGRSVPMDYLGWALLYALLYSSIAMLLALALFEDRDLA